MFIIPNMFKQPREFGLLALAVMGLVIVVGAMLGAARLLFPPLATPIERRGTGIGALDRALSGVGSKVASMVLASLEQRAAA